MRNLLFALLSLALMISCYGLEKSANLLNQQQIKLIQVIEMVEEMPTFLYKVLSKDDWEKSCRTIHLSSMDADFIHLSTDEQLDKIIEKYWSEASEYVLLKLEVAKLSGDLVLEANLGGTNKYYHLYKGSIPLGAIIELKVHKK